MPGFAFCFDGLTCPACGEVKRAPDMPFCSDCWYTLPESLRKVICRDWRRKDERFYPVALEILEVEGKRNRALELARVLGVAR